MYIISENWHCRHILAMIFRRVNIKKILKLVDLPLTGQVSHYLLICALNRNYNNFLSAVQFLDLRS